MSKTRKITEKGTTIVKYEGIGEGITGVEYSGYGTSGSYYMWTNTKTISPNLSTDVTYRVIGKIDLVITKDLSRLGRDYLQTGYYTEQYFPLHHVRYCRGVIVLTDGCTLFYLL